MQDLILFKSKNGNITKQDLYDALISVKADKCDYLFIHSELNFGLPNVELSKKDLMRHLLDVIMSLKVKNVLVPTFTFSFCNHEIFDVDTTKSSMGMLSEFFRKQPEAVRSVDPMMSVSVIGSDLSIVNNIGKFSCGKGSTFDLLHNRDNVKFLFLGMHMSACMTYSHYVEVMKNVPYRYPKKFSGTIIKDGISKEDDYYLHVRYKNIYPYEDNRIDDLMLKNDGGIVIPFGDSLICMAEEKKVYKYLGEAIDENPDFMLNHRCPPPPYEEYYVYEKKVAL